MIPPDTAVARQLLAAVTVASNAAADVAAFHPLTAAPAAAAAHPLPDAAAAAALAFAAAISAPPASYP